MFTLAFVFTNTRYPAPLCSIMFYSVSLTFVFTNSYDPRYEVIFQLGSIVHMVSRWRGLTRLRVCHLVERTEDIASERERIVALLADLRVFAEVSGTRHAAASLCLCRIDRL
jgi:hypothetical protein